MIYGPICLDDTISVYDCLLYLIYIAGEDGPTHQPIETLAICRSTPGIQVLRPADGNEVIMCGVWRSIFSTCYLCFVVSPRLSQTSGAYAAALSYRGPTVLALSRQLLPHLAGSSIENVQHGAYTIYETIKGVLGCPHKIKASYIQI